MKPIRVATLILFTCYLNINIYAQKAYPTESETHIFWQPKQKILASDFLGGNPSGSQFDRDMKFGRNTIPCLGIFLKVDVPRNYKKNKLEKVYFAPAFQRSCSYLLDKDTSNLRDAQLLFDIYELATRTARKLIWSTHAQMAIESDSTLIEFISNNPDTIFITGIGNIFAARARDSALNLANQMMYSYLSDLYFYVDSTSASYEEWRSLVDDGLNQHERFATKPEDCYRMIIGKPLLKKYKNVKLNVF